MLYIVSYCIFYLFFLLVVRCKSPTIATRSANVAAAAAATAPAALVADTAAADTTADRMVAADTVADTTEVSSERCHNILNCYFPNNSDLFVRRPISYARWV